MHPYEEEQTLTAEPGELPERAYYASDIRRVLERLARYYDGRIRSALHGLAECEDGGRAIERAYDVAVWEAKYEAVCKVADNLEIVLEPNKTA